MAAGRLCTSARLVGVCYLRKPLHRPLSGGTKSYSSNTQWSSLFDAEEKPNTHLDSDHHEVIRLVESYRNYGHQSACLDPLGLEAPELGKVRGEGKMDDVMTCSVNGVVHGLKADTISVNQLKGFLHSVYCGSITLESSQIQDEEEKKWIVKGFEEELSSDIHRDRQIEILQHLVKSQTFDNFMAKRFQTVKRYGGEGAESLVVFVEEALRHFRQGISGECTVVVGMPHRGRLNLLSGLLGYQPEAMFYKIKGHCEHPKGLPTTGDVLSHLYTSVDVPMATEGQGTVHVSLLPNPSHLEAINPVAMGNVRGRLKDSNSPLQIMCLQIHGDAAFSGQGIVTETLTLSNVPGFTVDGSVHVIVNNQIGFTTPPNLGRSTPYCSDAGKMIGCPVIHVNGASPEDVLRASRVAVDYKKNYKKDIIVDLVCFRKWGHNELDDPSMTQPIMYRAIDNCASIPDQYAAILKEEELADQTHKDYNEYLKECFKNSNNYKPKDTQLRERWSTLTWPTHQLTSWNTGCPLDVLRYVGGKSCEGRGSVHPKVTKIFQDRLKRVQSGQNLDWATAEAMAVGSILMNGFNVRLSGQDVGRGTFGHRHFVLVDQENETEDVPLQRLSSPNQGVLEVVNSPLSEEAVLGFEYGVSMSNPRWLVMWEAQFGDFFNGAQIIVDTFISSGEEKWLLQSGLVMLLPHGYDGAGPEHSSSRIERFLQMTNSSEVGPDGDDLNMQVVHPTTPAQYFHLLRRQVVRNFRKPLIVASPKILLRLPAATSSLAEMATGTTFHYVLSDPLPAPREVTKVVFCSGKHFYFLDGYRREKGIKDVAIVRLESLAPFPTAYIYQEISKYNNAKSYIWSQEEHRNMGPWTFVDARFRNQLGIQLRYAGRGPGGPPAVGTSLIHQEQVAELLQDTFHQ